MRLSRRGWRGAAAAMAGGAAAEGVRASPTVPPTPAARFLIRAPGAGHDYDAALAALADYARAELAAWGLPGMTLSVTDAEGFVAVLTLGWADRERGVPVGPRHLFQIGSISKSFIALTVLALSDQGKIDLDAPVARYLPEAPLPREAITVAQLLSHTSGLADGPPLFPRARGSTVVRVRAGLELFLQQHRLWPAGPTDRARHWRASPVRGRPDRAPTARPRWHGGGDLARRPSEVRRRLLAG